MSARRSSLDGRSGSRYRSGVGGSLLSARRSAILFALVLAVLALGVGLRPLLVRSPEECRVRPGESAGPERGNAERTAWAAPVAQKPGGSGRGDAAGGDRVRVTFRPAPPCGSGGSGTKAGASYPWAVPAAVKSSLEKLAGHRVNVSFTDAPISDVLAFMSELAGLRWKSSPPTDAGKRITFETEDLTLGSTLQLLLQQDGLAFAVGEDGSIEVGAPGKVTELPMVRALRGLDLARKLEAGDEQTGLAAADRALAEKLRDGTVSVQMQSASFGDAVAFLREYTGIQIGYTATEATGKISLQAEGKSADEVLRDVARQAGREVVFDHGTVALVGQEEAARIEAERVAREARAQDLLSRGVAFDGPAVAGPGLVEVLRQQAGTEVIVSEAVWGREELAVPLGARRLQEVLNYVTLQAGLQWRLVDGVVYVF